MEEWEEEGDFFELGVRPLSEVSQTSSDLILFTLGDRYYYGLSHYFQMRE